MRSTGTYVRGKRLSNKAISGPAAPAADRQGVGHTRERRMLAWSIAVFSVAGAFLIGGIGGIFAASVFGTWWEPSAGFLAAFAVVVVAYWAAPRKKLAFATACFVLGVLAAWVLVGNSDYPESYGEKAYQVTRLPFVVTCGGGFIGLLAVFTIERWRQLRGV